MAAEILRMEEYDYVPHPSKKMTIPLQSTVASFIKEKMGWSDEFCKYYADKFWNYYQAQGWKLANGNAMKDWRAAFCSQWKIPKQPEDKAFLEECKRKEAEQEKQQTPEQYLNKCLDLHKEGKYKPTSVEVLDIYDWLKSKSLMLLYANEVERIVRDAGNSRSKARMLAVRVLFDRMNAQGKRF